MSSTGSSTAELITLYDLDSKKAGTGTWSSNVWNTRMVLNYKRLPYRTVVLKHPEIEPTLASLGIPANPQVPPRPGAPVPSRYTVPAIQLPDASTVMDSAKIAHALESRYPEPSLLLDNKLHEKAFGAIIGFAAPLSAVYYPRVGRDMVFDEVLPAWREKREKQFGMPLDELERTRGGEQAWEAARQGIAPLKAFLKENKKDSGPFLLGSQVCYGDFVLASILEGMRRIGEDLYDQMCGLDDEGNLKRLHVACREKGWFATDR